MKTPEQIQRQIDGLLAMKTWLPQNSLFGDDNWRTIDEQVQTLKGESTFEELENVYDEDEESSPCSLWDAEGWLEGEIDEDLFEEE